MTDLLEPYVDTTVDDLPPLETATSRRRPAGAGPVPRLPARRLPHRRRRHPPGHGARATWASGAPRAGRSWPRPCSSSASPSGLVLRPRRWMAAVALLSSVAFIVSWWVTRYAGMPFGPAEHYLEDASTVDVTCVVLEARRHRRRRS